MTTKITLKTRFAKHVLAVVLALAGMSSSAYALESSFEGINFVPAMDDTPYYTVYGSKNLDPLQFRAGLYFDYGHTPLECQGCPTREVIDDLVMGNFSFGLGVNRFFEFGVGLPVALYSRFNNENTGTEQTDGGVGDIRLDTKFSIVDIDAHRIGFAVAPFITFPTGDAAKFLGAGTVTGGGKLIVDFKPIDAFELSLNVGYRARDNVTRTNTNIDDQALYGLGMVGHVTPHVDVLAEIQGSTVVKDFFASSPQSPLEAELGVRYRMDNGFAFNIGGGPGIVDGVGTPQFRAIAGITFTPPAGDAPVAKKSPKHARLDEAKKVIITDKIYFDFDKDTLKAESLPVLDDVATVMKEDSRIKLVMVEGHTDSVGSASYNDNLSDRRAKAAMNYLVKAGVDASRLQSSGKGESQPIASNATDDGRAQNRRTEFLVMELAERGR